MRDSQSKLDLNPDIHATGHRVGRQSGVLRGIAWNHSRGYVPFVATAQRFEDLGYGEICWQKRSLRDFGDQDLEELVLDFDLLLIDHPHIGRLVSLDLLEPLDRHFGDQFIAGLREGSVGRSFDSYWFEDRLWALPVDTAAPVSSWRPDLFNQARIELPQTWEHVCELAGRGSVIIPATPVDSLMNFYMLCCALGEGPFYDGRLLSRDVALEALRLLRELIQLCSPECLHRDPIQTYREMVLSTKPLYCPFAFGYSNYSRAAYAPAELEFGGLVNLDGKPFRSTLGGVGIALSRNCRCMELALSYLGWVTLAPVQKTIYFHAGGQPAHRTAWLDGTINAACKNYFRNTLATVDAAYLRPRHNGYVQFQNEASAEVHAYLRAEKDAVNTVDALNEAHSRSVNLRY